MGCFLKHIKSVYSNLISYKTRDFQIESFTVHNPQLIDFQTAPVKLGETYQLRHKVTVETTHGISHKEACPSLPKIVVHLARVVVHQHVLGVVIKKQQLDVLKVEEN